MVENQWGSSDMIQSMAAKVVTSTNKTVPGPLNICIRRVGEVSDVASCAAVHLFRRKAKMNHTRK